MGLFSFFSKQREEQRLANLADEIAERVRDVVWQRVRERVPTLGINETRGYVRARSASVIQAEVSRIIKANLGAKESQRSQLVGATVVAVQRLVMSMTKTQRTATPLRRAA